MIQEILEPCFIPHRHTEFEKEENILLESALYRTGFLNVMNIYNQNETFYSSSRIRFYTEKVYQ